MDAMEAALDAAQDAMRRRTATDNTYAAVDGPNMRGAVRIRDPARCAFVSCAHSALADTQFGTAAITEQMRLVDDQLEGLGVAVDADWMHCHGTHGVDARDAVDDIRTALAALSAVEEHHVGLANAVRWCAGAVDVVAAQLGDALTRLGGAFAGGVYADNPLGIVELVTGLRGAIEARDACEGHYARMHCLSDVVMRRGCAAMHALLQQSRAQLATQATDPLMCIELQILAYKFGIKLRLKRTMPCGTAYPSLIMANLQPAQRAPYQSATFH
eukprot:Opistho-2@65840